jgi:23S rRNA (guanosine2251-2'-O)-methyltransferase
MREKITANFTTTADTMKFMERLPFQATLSGAVYESIQQLPVSLMLENIRSLFNVGSFFRTADAASVERLYLAGYTATPPRKEISKVALGAEETVAWEPSPAPLETLQRLRATGYEIAAIETSVHSVDLFDWAPCFPLCVVFGNELEGLTPEVSQFADTHVRIPMLGMKHSLNVATAAGVVVYELLRKYRRMLEALP